MTTGLPPRPQDLFRRGDGQYVCVCGDLVGRAGAHHDGRWVCLPADHSANAGSAPRDAAADTGDLRARLVEALNNAHKPSDEPHPDDRHDGHSYDARCYVCRGDVEKLADALLPAVEDVLADATGPLVEKLRAAMPVGALWRIVLGPRGAPEYWPLTPNTSAFQVAMLLAEARRTWPDAYAESRGVGPWRESDPTERPPTADLGAATAVVFVGSHPLAETCRRCTWDSKPFDTVTDRYHLAELRAPTSADLATCHGCGSLRIVTRSRRAYCTEPTCDRRLPGPPCETCTRPRSLHVCLSCSPDELTAGPGCGNCRNTGWNQTPCLPPITAAITEETSC